MLAAGSALAPEREPGPPASPPPSPSHHGREPVPGWDGSPAAPPAGALAAHADPCPANTQGLAGATDSNTAWQAQADADPAASGSSSAERRLLQAEQQAARLAAELAAAKQSLATYKSTLEHLVSGTAAPSDPALPPTSSHSTPVPIPAAPGSDRLSTGIMAAAAAPAGAAGCGLSASLGSAGAPPAGALFEPGEPPPADAAALPPLAAPTASSLPTSPRSQLLTQAADAPAPPPQRPARMSDLGPGLLQPGALGMSPDASSSPYSLAGSAASMSTSAGGSTYGTLLGGTSPAGLGASQSLQPHLLADMQRHHQQHQPHPHPHLRAPQRSFDGVLRPPVAAAALPARTSDSGGGPTGGLGLVAGGQQPSPFGAPQQEDSWASGGSGGPGGTVDQYASATSSVGELQRQLDMLTSQQSVQQAVQLQQAAAAVAAQQQRQQQRQQQDSLVYQQYANLLASSGGCGAAAGGGAGAGLPPVASEELLLAMNSLALSSGGAAAGGGGSVPSGSGDGGVWEAGGGAAAAAAAAAASQALQAQAFAQAQAMQQAQLLQQLQQFGPYAVGQLQWLSGQQQQQQQAVAAAAAAAAVHEQQQQQQQWAYAQLLAGSSQHQQHHAQRRISTGSSSRHYGDTASRDTRKHSSSGDKPVRAPRVRDDPPDWRRVFVGNIGWWVDEEMLRRYFGQYGTVVDVQVMWNTKLLAKGKHVNREFCFISFSTPDEAGAAIQAMNGAVIEGLVKDMDGLTVQFEAQGFGQGAHHSVQAQVNAAQQRISLPG